MLLSVNGKAQPVDPSVVGEDNVVIRYAPLYNCYSHDFMASVEGTEMDDPDTIEIYGILRRIYGLNEDE